MTGQPNAYGASFLIHDSGAFNDGYSPSVAAAVDGGFVLVAQPATSCSEAATTAGRGVRLMPRIFCGAAFPEAAEIR